jgi:hypothetical protein
MIKQALSLLLLISSSAASAIATTKLTTHQPSSTTLQLAFASQQLDTTQHIFNQLVATPRTPPPASISFLIADLKLDDLGRTKILEFGQGTRSYFKGYDQLYTTGHIWQQLWQHLATYKLPIWHIGDLKKSAAEADQIALETARACGVTQYSSLSILEKTEAFKHALATARATNSSAGIVVLHHHVTTAAALNLFRQTYPSVMIMDDVSHFFVNSKFMTNLLFEQDEQLHNLRPHCKTYSKKLSAQLLQTLHTDFAAYQQLVIKPLDAANGWGVIITNHALIEAELHTIMHNKESLIHCKDETYRYWLSDRNAHFIIEAFAPSKTIVTHNKPYDPTMRQIFIVEQRGDAIKITFLGSYWKLPARSLTARGSVTQLHKSNVAPNRPSSAPVSEEDDAAARSALTAAMPRLYQKMMRGR